MSELYTMWHSLGGWHQASLIVSAFAYLFDFILKRTILKEDVC